jgi:hypothetical protein
LVTHGSYPLLLTTRLIANVTIASYSLSGDYVTLKWTIFDIFLLGWAGTQSALPHSPRTHFLGRAMNKGK